MADAGPVLIPPRDGIDIGDYSLRDFAAKWLVQQADLAEIGRYRDANRRLARERGGARPVILYGDSITEFWAGAGALKGADWRAVNRGIAGQNTTQLLLRFEDDVVALAPAAVVLLGGTNDLRSYAGPPVAILASAKERIARNVTAMADIASARGIDMLLCTIPPVGSGLDPYRDPDAILAANDWIVSFAEQRHLPLIDYHRVLVDERGRLPGRYSDDAVHPNHVAYGEMLAALRRGLEIAGYVTT